MSFHYDGNGQRSILVKPEASSKTNLGYTRALVHSGLSGLRQGRDSQLDGQPLSAVLTPSARAGLNLAVIGSFAGLLALYLPGRRHRIAKTVVCGLAGSAIGFVAGFTWKSRHFTANMARSAFKEMGAVRDERWLEKHPIDFG